MGGGGARHPGEGGSTYVYGYVDATFKEGMSKDECVNFCTNSESFNYRVITFNTLREGTDVCV